MFFTSYPKIRVVRTHSGKPPVCLPARMGVKELELEARRSDAMVGGAGVAESPGPLFFRKQKVGLGIY